MNIKMLGFVKNWASLRKLLYFKSCSHYKFFPMIQIVTEVINSCISLRFIAMCLFVLLFAINRFAQLARSFNRLIHSQDKGFNALTYASVSQRLKPSENGQHNCREFPTDNTAHAVYRSSCIFSG
jgi:hypothetical protein